MRLLSVSAPFIQMNDFRLLRPAVSEMQSNERLDLLESLTAGRSRIQKQHTVQIGDALDLQNVAVSTYKYIGGILGQLFTHPPLPSARAACNVGHPEPHTGHLETVVFRIGMAQTPTVYISPDRTYRGDGFQLINQVNRTDIPGMQDQVHILQISVHVWMKPTVGVRKDSENHF